LWLSNRSAATEGTKTVQTTRRCGLFDHITPGTKQTVKGPKDERNVYGGKGPSRKPNRCNYERQWRKEDLCEFVKAEKGGPVKQEFTKTRNPTRAKRKRRTDGGRNLLVPD